jgi:hypothetical protein
VHISQTFIDLELGDIQQYCRLAVVPLVRRCDGQHSETEAWYLTLDEATVKRSGDRAGKSKAVAAFEKSK